HEGPERRINHPLALDAVLADKGRTLDFQGEVTLSGRIVAAMPAMLLAVVAELDTGRRQRGVEAREHFGRDRTGSLDVHCPYIGGFNGDEAIQDARTGRRGEGALRRPRMSAPRRI